MSEEQVKECDEPEVEAPELSIEEQAAAYGWRPDGKNMFGETVTAERYLQEKPLYNTIGKLKNTLHTLDTRVETMAKNQKTMAQSFIKEQETLLAKLKEQREEAIDDMDNVKVRQLNKQIEETSAIHQPKTDEVTTYSKTDWKNAYIGFLKENSWYDQQPGKKSAADIIGQEFAAANPNAAPKDIYDYVVKEMKNEFPDLFDEKRPNSKVSSSNRRPASGNTKTKVKLSDFDEETQAVYRVMAKASNKSIEDYLNP